MLIHCKTQEEWDKVLARLNDGLFCGTWEIYKENSVLNDNHGMSVSYGRKKYYKEEPEWSDQKIIEASDYLGEPKFKVGDKVRWEDDHNVIARIGCIEGGVAFMDYCKNTKCGKVYQYPDGGNCEIHRNFMGYPLNSLELYDWKEDEKQEPVEPSRPEPKFQIGQVLKFYPKEEGEPEIFTVSTIDWGKKLDGKEVWYYWTKAKDGEKMGYPEDMCELYCGEPLVREVETGGKNRHFVCEESGPVDFVKCQEYFNKVNEMFFGGISNNKPKKTIMNTIVDFAKNLTLPVDEKLLRKVGIKNDQGNYTEAAREIVVNFEAVALGYKDEQDLFNKVGYSNNLSSFEYASLLKKYEDKLIEVAKQMEEENKKK